MGFAMGVTLAETLRSIRLSKGLSQQQVAERIYVTRSTIANWETGRRVPDAIMLRRIADCLDTDIRVLLGSTESESARPEVIVVDDEKLILSDSISIIEKVVPNLQITGFSDPAEALEYAGSSNIALAFIDIEMGPESGLDLCRKLLETDRHTNVIFLTAHSEYSLDAWKTGASGFLMKPFNEDDVKAQLGRLRFPVAGLF